MTEASKRRKGSHIHIGELLSGCLDAALKAGDVIRQVHNQRLLHGARALSATLEDDDDYKSAITIADTRAEAVIFSALKATFGSTLQLVGEESEKVDGDASVDVEVNADVDVDVDVDVDADDDVDDTGVCKISKTSDVTPLRLNLLEPGTHWSLECPNEFTSVPRDALCVFVDPVDGTGEFTKGNVHRCQTLIGISMYGRPIAGVMGLPFWERNVAGDIVVSDVAQHSTTSHKHTTTNNDNNNNNNNNTTNTNNNTNTNNTNTTNNNNNNNNATSWAALCGIVGAGVSGGNVITPTNDINNNNINNNNNTTITNNNPINNNNDDDNSNSNNINDNKNDTTGGNSNMKAKDITTGFDVAASFDNKQPLPHVRTKLTECGHRLHDISASANKILHVLCGSMDVAVFNFKTSYWDTCATEAIIAAAGGRVTDLCGCGIHHTVLKSNIYKNWRGVVATRQGVDHDAFCATLRSVSEIGDLFKTFGLKAEEQGHSIKSLQATDVCRDVWGDVLTAAQLSTMLKMDVQSYSAPDQTAMRYIMSQAVQLKCVLSTGSTTTVFYKRAVMRDLSHVTLKVKTAPIKLLRDVKSYNVEVSFLGSQACKLLVDEGVAVPKVHSAVCVSNVVSPIDSKFAVVLEDFSYMGQVGILGMHELKAVLRELARMHAFFFPGSNFHTETPAASKEISEVVWPMGTYWSPGKQSATLPDILTSEWSKHFAAFSPELAKVVKPADLTRFKELGIRLKQQISDCSKETHVLTEDHPHRTIIHGDAKAMNFFFDNKKTPNMAAQDGELKCGLIDFQWCGYGLGAVDVAYAIVSSAEPSLFDDEGKFEQDILECYHTHLIHALVRFGAATSEADARTRVIPFETFLKQYNTALLDYCLVVISYHWTRIKATPEVLTKRAHMRGSNSYNKNVAAAVWVMRKCDRLLTQREQAQQQQQQY